MSTKQLISIENYIENPKETSLINSPRSLCSMINLGLTNADIIYISFKYFLNNNYDIIRFPKNIQKKRYDFYEEIRQKKIHQIKDYKDNKIDEEKFLEFMNKDTQNNNNNEIDKKNILNIIDSQEIKLEQKNFERIKKKNEMDLINSVTHELEREVQKKEEEKKLRKIAMKNDNYKKEINLKNQIDLINKNKKEYEKYLNEEIEEEKRKKENLLKYEKEIEKMKEDEKKEKARQKEIKLKQKKLEQKKEEFEKKVNEMNLKYIENLQNKMIELEEKQQKRENDLEQKRLNNILKNQEKKKKTEEKIKKNKKNLENKLKEIKNKYENKNLIEKIKKQQFDERKNEELKKKSEILKQKIENSKKVLENDKIIQQNKIDKFLKKQQEIEIRQKIIEEEKIKQNLLKQEKNEKLKQNLIKARQKNNEMLNEKINNYIQDMKKKENITNEVLNKKFIDNQNKFEENNIKFMTVQDNIKRMERLNELKKKNNLDDINKKANKINKFKLQQEIINEEKNKFKDDFSRRKAKYQEEFLNIFNKSKLDNNSIQNIKKIFPNNPKINYLINKINTLEKEEISDYNEIKNNEKLYQKKLKNLKHNKNNFSVDQKLSPVKHLNKSKIENKDNKYFSITDSTNFNTTEKNLNKNICKSNNNNHRKKKFINLKIKPNSSRYDQRTKPKKPEFLKEIDFYKIKSLFDEYQIKNDDIKNLNNDDIKNLDNNEENEIN